MHERVREHERVRGHERERTLRKDLRAIWVDGLAWSVMVGMGETYIPAFALAIGLSPVYAGLVATVPMVVGSIVQLLSLRWIERVGSHRRWVVACSVLQAASFLPMAAGALSGGMTGWMLYACAALYWASGLATGPAWSTWVETLVPARVRIRYFARRNRYLQVFQIVGLLAAGTILQAGERFELRAFAIVFLFAGIARAISAMLLASQSEPEPMPAEIGRVSVREFVARFRHGHDGRLLVYMLSVQLATQVAIPFFTPYLLDVLRFSYASTMALLGAAVLARFVALPLFGRFAERFGLHALLWIGGLAIVPAAALWIVSERFEILLLAQLFTGTAFAAYELATFLLFFESIRARERTSVLTTFNAANSTAILFGSMIGGACLLARGSSAAAFVVVFALSALLRILTILFLKRVAHAPGLVAG
jgi:MFS family permease